MTTYDSTRASVQTKDKLARVILELHTTHTPSAYEAYYAARDELKAECTVPEVILRSQAEIDAEIGTVLRSSLLRGLTYDCLMGSGGICPGSREADRLRVLGREKFSVAVAPSPLQKEVDRLRAERDEFFTQLVLLRTGLSKVLEAK